MAFFKAILFLMFLVLPRMTNCQSTVLQNEALDLCDSKNAISEVLAGLTKKMDMIIAQNNDQTRMDEIYDLLRNQSTKLAHLEQKLDACECTNNKNMNTGKSDQCPIGFLQEKNSCYKFVKTPKSWQNARTHCLSMSAHLVAINSAEENQFLFDTINNTYGITFGDWWWTGGNDLDSEGTFKWDGANEVMNYTSWSPGEPNNAGNEHCVMLFYFYRNAPLWNDESCSFVMNMICEKEL